MNATDNGFIVECLASGSWPGSTVVQPQLFYVAELYNVDNGDDVDDVVERRHGPVGGRDDESGGRSDEEMSPVKVIANVTIDASVTWSGPTFIFADLPRPRDSVETESARGASAAEADDGEDEDTADTSRKTYRVRVYAQNHKGRSAVRSITVHLPNSASKYQTKRELFRRGIVAICCCCFLICFFFLLLLCPPPS